MALVNLESALRKAVFSLKKCSPGCGLEILSYKRNRGVSIWKCQDETYMLREHGYLEQRVEVEEGELTKILKAIMKREFPRSRKVRIYSLKDPSLVGIKRKIL